MMKTHKEFIRIEQTTPVSKTCSEKHLLGGFTFSQKGLDDDAWDSRTLSKVVREQPVLDSLILKLLTRFMKDIQFSILCAKAQKLPSDVGPNANDLLTFPRIIQGCVTKRSLQYFSHFQRHVSLTPTPFYFLLFFGFGNRWTSIVWTKNSTTRHVSLQTWNSFIDDKVPLVLNKLNKLSSTCKIHTLISRFRGGTTLNQGDMYLLLSRDRSFSTQSNFSKCLLGFDQNLKPRDRCSITKNIRSISKSSYLTRLPKIFHQVLCKLIVPSYRGGHAYRLICPTAHNDIRWVTPVNCGGGILLSSQTQDTG